MSISFLCSSCGNLVKDMSDTELFKCKDCASKLANPPPENRDCDSCVNDGECYVTILKCKGYVREIDIK
jgi:hypothetical protein